MQPSLNRTFTGRPKPNGGMFLDPVMNIIRSANVIATDSKTSYKINFYTAANDNNWMDGSLLIADCHSSYFP